jgi:hypothetical protein
VVNLLVQQLAVPSSPIRDGAGRRLAEIGLPALPPLRRAAREADPEVRVQIQELIAGIERGPRTQRPIAIGGAEFQVVADQIWKVPQAGGVTPLRVGLGITNIGEEDLVITIAEPGSVSPMLMAADGEPVATEKPRQEGAVKDARLLRLAPGERTTYWFSDAKLESSNARTGLRLVLAGTGGGSAFVGLSQGTYYLRLHYRDVRVPENAGPTGLGDLFTDAVEVEVR